MPVAQYSDFEWRTPAACNGRSGEALSNLFINIIKSTRGLKTICDLGCGNGYLSGQLASLGYEVTGIDASETGVELAKSAYAKAIFIKGLIDGELGTRAKLANFDAVISSDVIEHLYRPADLIEAASSVLSRSGHLIIGTPYHGYLKNLALGVTGKMDSHFSVLHDGGHIKFFSVPTLSQLIRKHGFEDLRFTFYGRAMWLWKNMICHARKR